MSKYEIKNVEGKKVGDAELSSDVYGIEPNIPVVHQVVVCQDASARQGTHSTKNRHEVSGGGVKPYRQKGTGRARQGSIRAGQWTGGGVIFESKKLYERELPGFIETYLRQHQVTIEPKAAQMIADHVGADLNRLTSELDKLLLSRLTTNGRVTPEVVE